VYFGRDGDVLVILLTGGTKQRQTTRHRGRQEQLDGLQAATAAPEMTDANMALTKSFKELVQRCEASDAAFGDARRH